MLVEYTTLNMVYIKITLRFMQKLFVHLKKIFKTMENNSGRLIPLLILILDVLKILKIILQLIILNFNFINTINNLSMYTGFSKK